MLQNDASIQQMKVAQFNAGGRPPKRKRIYQTINDRIRTVQADYGNKKEKEKCCNEEASTKKGAKPISFWKCPCHQRW